MSSEDIRILVDSTPLEAPPKLIAVALSEFLALELPPRELILSPWLPRAGLCMIHAFRGIGKTHLSLGIAYAVAKGCSFLGWTAATPKTLLFIDGEMPAITLQERLKRIVAMSGDSTLPLGLKIITPDLQPDGVMPDIGTIEGQQLLEPLISDDIDLIILDNISCLAPSIKENDAFDWGPIQTWVLRLRARGKSVLLIHHSGKSGAQRGTSKKEDVLDTVITLERPKDYESNQGARFVVKYEKARGFFGDDAKSFEARLISTGDASSWETKAVDGSTYEKVVALASQGLPQKEIVAQIGIDKSGVSRYMSLAKKEGLLQSHEDQL